MKAIVKKELRSLLNEKTLLLAVIVQLFIASFSSMIVIGLASFFDPSSLSDYDSPKAKVGIVGQGDLIPFLEKSRLHLHLYRDVPSALSDFYRNRIDAIIVIPKEKEEGTNIIDLSIYLPKSDIRGTFVTLQLKKPLEEYESYVREIRSVRTGFEPVNLYVNEIPEKTSTYFEFIYGILIPLLVFTPVFISGGLIIDMVTEEYERKTMDLLLVSPLSFSSILKGKMITAIIIVPAQALLWLLLLNLNGVDVHNIALILIVSTIAASIVVILGAVIAVKYQKRMISQYLYSLVLILMFLAGYLFTSSPFNLVTRLSADSIGIQAISYPVMYAAAAIILYIFSARILYPKIV